MAYKKGNMEDKGCNKYDAPNNDMSQHSDAENEKENFPSNMGYNVVDYSKGRKSKTVNIKKG